MKADPQHQGEGIERAEMEANETGKDLPVADPQHQEAAEEMARRRNDQKKAYPREL